MPYIGDLADELNRQEWAVERMLKNRGYLKQNGEPRKSTIDDGLMREDGFIYRKGWNLFIDALGYRDSVDDDEDEEDGEDEIINDDDDSDSNDDEAEEGGFKAFADEYSPWHCTRSSYDNDFFKSGKTYDADSIINFFHQLNTTPNCRKGWDGDVMQDDPPELSFDYLHFIPENIYRQRNDIELKIEVYKKEMRGWNIEKLKDTIHSYIRKAYSEKYTKNTDEKWRAVAAIRCFKEKISDDDSAPQRFPIIGCDCIYCSNGICRNDENPYDYNQECPGDCDFFYS